jgi:tetratricopeptide (TPR) repeat protein
MNLAHCYCDAILRRCLRYGVVAAMLVLPLGAHADDVDRAIEARQRGDLETAIELVTHAIDSGDLSLPRLITALEVRCFYYGYADRLEEALADCNHGLELDPKYGPLLINRAILYVAMDKFELARADLDNALQDDRLNDLGTTLAYFHRGRTWKRQNDPKRALADFGMALSIRPSHYPTRVERGGVLTQVGRYYQAVSDFEAAISLHDNLPNAYLGRAEARMGLAEFSKALADVDKAGELGAPPPQIARVRGLIYFFMGRNEEAIAEFSRVLVFQADLSLSRYMRGIAAFNAGHFARAATDFEQLWQSRNGADAALWLYLARSRMSPPLPAEAEIAQVIGDNASPDSGKWPEPLLRFIVGEINEAQAFAEASQVQSYADELSCQANFYLGEVALLRKEASHGRKLLQNAILGCRIDTVEYIAAKAELERMAE